MNNEFIGNNATNGGAIYMNGLYASNFILISANKFWSNFAALGGAVNIENCNEPEIFHTVNDYISNQASYGNFILKTVVIARWWSLENL